ncbi:MAG: hypothetical protein IV100_10315 [Myxococcales bacterium]|nr:hypothetical protein [Myxococcales bacterium]
MHAISHGNISAVRFDTLAVIVSGDGALTVGVHELQDLMQVVQELLNSARSAAPRQSAKTSALLAAIAGGALKDYDDFEPKLASTVPAHDAVEPVSTAPTVARVEAPAPVKAAESPKAAPVPALQRRARGTRDVPSASARTAAPAPAKAAAAAAPAAPAAPVAPPPVVTKVDEAPVPSAAAGKRPANEILSEAVIAFLEPRTRPQSVDRIARAVRKVDGAPQVTEVQLRELLKILVKKGILTRSPAGGHSIAGVE